MVLPVESSGVKAILLRARPPFSAKTQHPHPNPNGLSNQTHLSRVPSKTQLANSLPS